MKKLLAMTAAAVFAAMPALAAANVIKFEPTGSDESLTITFNDDGTMATDTGATGTFTWDEVTLTICGTFDGAEGENCATFAEVSDEVGFSTTYTAKDGSAGTATLVEVQE